VGAPPRLAKRAGGFVGYQQCPQLLGRWDPELRPIHHTNRMEAWGLLLDSGNRSRSPHRDPGAPQASVACTRLQELTGTGWIFQIRSAYSWIERSLLKKPQRAVLSRDIRFQRRVSTQAPSTASWQRR